MEQSTGLFVFRGLFYVVIASPYSPADAGIVPVWARSWIAQGWSPRLILDFHPPVKKAVSVKTVRLINFSLRPPRKLPAKLPAKRWRTRGWETAPVVLFPKTATVDDITQALNTRAAVR